jgi:predicted dehydrogenase
MLKGAVIGTGFWANFQIAAWQELEDVAITSLYNRTRNKAELVAKKFGIPAVYDDLAVLLEKERPDFVDIITDVGTHAAFTQIAAQHNVQVICQKPMESSVQQAEEMLQVCAANDVRLFIHENFRWQLPLRKLKAALDSGIIGKPFKARVSFCSAFPVFDNQQFLKALEHFILTDIGSHVLDVCRFLFGDVKSLYCLTQRINRQIKGEDVANVLMEMQSGLHCFAEMSYASVMEKEAFPQTFVFVEGERGSLHLTHDFQLKVITPTSTTASVVQPPLYAWADPDYAVVHASIVDCNRNILKGLNGGNAETTGEDNFRTVQLVWAAYASAATGKTIHF